MDTAWDVVKIIAMGALALLSLSGCYLLYKLGKGLGEIMESTEELIDGVTKETVPLLSEVTTSVVHVNEELVRVDAITENVQTMTSNIGSLVALFGATLGTPLVKMAAFSYGVRKAISGRNKADLEAHVQAKLKADRRTRRAARKSAGKA